MFQVIEIKLRRVLKQRPRKISDKDLSLEWFNEPIVAQVHTFLHDQSKISKEVCANVLQDVIALYIRVRVFRFLDYINENLAASRISFRATLLAAYSAVSKNV